MTMPPEGWKPGGDGATIDSAAWTRQLMDAASEYALAEFDRQTEAQLETAETTETKMSLPKAFAWMAGCALFLLGLVPLAGLTARVIWRLFCWGWGAGA